MRRSYVKGLSGWFEAFSFSDSVSSAVGGVLDLFMTVREIFSLVFEVLRFFIEHVRGASNDESVSTSVMEDVRPYIRGALNFLHQLLTASLSRICLAFHSTRVPSIIVLGSRPNNWLTRLSDSLWESASPGTVGTSWRDGMLYLLAIRQSLLAIIWFPVSVVMSIIAIIIDFFFPRSECDEPSSIAVPEGGDSPAIVVDVPISFGEPLPTDDDEPLFADASDVPEFGPRDVNNTFQDQLADVRRRAARHHQEVSQEAESTSYAEYLDIASSWITKVNNWFGAIAILSSFYPNVPSVPYGLIYAGFALSSCAVMCSLVAVFRSFELGIEDIIEMLSLAIQKIFGKAPPPSVSSVSRAVPREDSSEEGTEPREVLFPSLVAHHGRENLDPSVSVPPVPDEVTIGPEPSGILADEIDNDSSGSVSSSSHASSVAEAVRQELNPDAAPFVVNTSSQDFRLGPFSQ